MCSSSQKTNGIRPRPLKIHEDSYIIKKHTSSCSTASFVTSHRLPVIIYTQSPKVIHTQPCDFMALVQKLTGFSRPPADDAISNHSSPPLLSTNDVKPAPNKKRKFPVVAKKKEDVMQPLDDTLLFLPPASTIGLEFDHLPTDMSFLMQRFSPESFYGSSNMSYRYNEMHPSSSSSMSDVDSSTLTFSDL